jgi:hypothetical protein
MTDHEPAIDMLDPPGARGGLHSFLGIIFPCHKQRMILRPLYALMFGCKFSGPSGVFIEFPQVKY